MPRRATCWVPHASPASWRRRRRTDRKSTRLNSSHLVISYAVFCLKKKTQLTLAREVRKPVVVHAREADDDVAAMLRRADTPVVLHSFSSGPGVFDARMTIAPDFCF